MAFVNEEYSAEDKPLVDRLVKRRPPLTRIPGSSIPGLSEWTVDRERDAFLVLVGKEGGTYEGTQEIRHYVLVLGEHEIHFSGEYHVTGYRSKGEPQIMTWTIHQLSVPSSLASQKEEALALVREALDAQGLYHCRESLASVIINFNPALAL
ncbi:MAG: hypothetical protein LBQ75_00320 [Zoogloeaceae bacterium]|jgi:hypothetical protein|nr:hypothetical protein [Zoogloeaceae bacterium]